jgi:hypothetical protein
MSRKRRLVGHVAHMGRKGILVIKREGKDK